MTNEEFLLKMQSWQRRLLREQRGIRMDIVVFEHDESAHHGVVMASVYSPQSGQGHTMQAYPPGHFLEEMNGRNAREMDELIEKLLNDN